VNAAAPKPRDRVVLLDSLGTVEDVAAGLGTAADRVEVEAAEEIPAGPGIVALLLGPETELTPRQIEALPDLRIVAVTSTGYDHVPLDAVAAHGGWVTHNAGYCTQEVADHTLALVLGLIRRTTVLDRAVRAGRWDVTANPPRRIAGTVLGLVGLGRIGRAVADRARGLGMRVLAHDPRCGADVFAAHGAEQYPDLHSLLGASDVVSLHMPLTTATRGLMDRTAFAAMKPGAFLVNVARGDLVDHTALAEALGRGTPAGAALDVLPVEPPPADDPLLGLDGVLITPHAAWYSPEAVIRPFRQAAARVGDVLAGREPAGAVARPKEDRT
jgi:D-3-phosphoglycerate dehydrogenase